MNDAIARNFDEIGASQRIVYVRPVRPEELPEEAQAATVYAIHDLAGNRIGIAPDRDLAFVAARQHELNPVSVH
ncbi:MAG: DUF1150 family protein [Pseudomonadota bacterium]